MAHKKGGGSTRNGRDTAGRRLGVKRFGGEVVRAGTIVLRERGSALTHGRNVAMGRDCILYALTDGVVKFERMGRKRKIVSVEPVSG